MLYTHSKVKITGEIGMFQANRHFSIGVPSDWRPYARRFFVSMTCLMLCQSAFADWDWQAYASPDGTFTAIFPASTSQTQNTLETNAGQVQYHSITSDVENGQIVMGIAYNEFSDQMELGAPQTVLDGGRDGAVANLKGQLISETELTFHGHPGREFTISAGKGDSKLFYHTRVFLVDRRLYQLQVVRVGQSPLDISDVVKFFAGFELAQTNS